MARKLTIEEVRQYVQENWEGEQEFSVTKEYDVPTCLEHEISWATAKDYLVAEVTMSDGDKGYLGKVRTSEGDSFYLLTDTYIPVAKQCRGSNIMFDLSSFTKLKRGKFGVHSRSKQYRCVESADRYQRVPEYWKTPNVLDKQANWREANREYLRSKSRAHYSANAERYAEVSRQYYAENKEYFRRWHKDYYAENKSELREYSRKYYQKNPNVSRRASQKRRLVKEGGYNELQFMAEFENSPTRTCWLSQHTTADGNEVHLEHMMPVSVDNQKPYGNSETNCYYLLGSLNISKGKKNVFDWIDSMSQSHLQFLLEDYPVELSLQQFTEGMYRIISELAEKQGLTFEQYKEQYNRDYAEGLQEEAS